MQLGKAADFIGLKRTSGAYQALASRRRAVRRRLGLRSWSQFGEDLVLAHYLPEYGGQYVDIGAGHPVDGSNTYYFYRRGWSGTLVEANPDLARSASRARKRDHVVNALCGELRGDATLYQFADWHLATMDPARVVELEGMGIHPVQTVELPVVTIRSLGLEAQPEAPTLLSVDVEGADLAVLRGIDWSLFQPRVVCIEELAWAGSEGNEVTSLLRDLGYRFVSRCVSSSIYVHEVALRTETSRADTSSP